MKKLIFILVVAILASCQSGDQTEKIRGKIKEKKNQVSQINHEIALLEKELIELTGSDTTQNILVRTDTLKPREFKHFFEASGSVESINEAFISPEISGQIREIFVKEGDRVSKGQYLVKLNTSVTDNTIEEFKTSLELAETVFEKQKQLWEKQIGSEIQYLEAKNQKESLETRLKTLEAQLEMASIKSPIDGIVDEIFQKEGELAIPGVQIMQLVNLSELYINADIAENYLPVIRKGDTVSVSFPSYPDIQLKVPIHRIGNVINPTNRTFNIQLKISNIDSQLKPNILSIIKINDYSTEQAMLIPSILMKQDRKGSYIYKVTSGSDKLIAKKVYVEPGVSYQDQTEVNNGLNTGDIIITEGYNLVSDGSEIRIK
ncbi:MAG: efflux RND transporter periplasmic adaptor subunit [Bacteroidetes bacterium]|nr:efflux RND transporter periplasmic adaptor subunit [Bacteroidota bacterium]